MKRVVLFYFLLISISLVLGACSKKKHNEGEKYKLEEFNQILDTSGATPDKSGTVITFSDYAPGVSRVNSKNLSYERLSFFALEFESEEEARNEALRLNQYYSRNWLFDRVEGEPILEDFVIVKFHAKNPHRRLQRKPVHIPSSPVHGEHGAPAAAGH